MTKQKQLLNKNKRQSAIELQNIEADENKIRKSFNKFIINLSSVTRTSGQALR